MKSYTYTETVKFTIEIKAESKEQAEYIASEFIESVLDTCGSSYEFHKNSTKRKIGVEDYSLETKDYSIK